MVATAKYCSLTPCRFYPFSKHPRAVRGTDGPVSGTEGPITRTGPPLWGCAKGAAKASCGETVVQKGVFGESVSSLPPQGLLLKHLKDPENLKGAEKKRTLPKHPFGQPFLRTTPSPLLWRTPILIAQNPFQLQPFPLWF